MHATIPPIIVALDFDNGSSALQLVDQLSPDLCRLKVGKELFTREGPSLVRELVKREFEVFLDLKFHDIPNTTAKAVAAAADLGVWMVNVHAFGGHKMMEAAAKQLAGMGSNTLLIAVTVLTSMGSDDLKAVGIDCSLQDQTMKLAGLAKHAGLNGVVCSAREAGLISRQLGEEFLRVTPGIRPAGANADDQVRIMTPAQALLEGSNYLVVGRPVTAANDPKKALLEIIDEVSNH